MHPKRNRKGYPKRRGKGYPKRSPPAARHGGRRQGRRAGGRRAARRRAAHRLAARRRGIRRCREREYECERGGQRRWLPSEGAAREHIGLRQAGLDAGKDVSR